ncbi:HEAT repeat domain-containing protein [Pyrococcus kukulkanii]|uniref:HEAT repeat domain-containing protein n=2 Tax=Pyrococcus kukulkanii TaxID=1609559 RepID=A0ABV4T0S2_9EURY|nr:HEAT repeat domain-containing protein [Pyrococcus kukulkanii]
MRALSMERGFSIINIKQLRNDIKKWKIKEAINTLSLTKDKIEVLRELLRDKDSTIRGNTLFIIEKMVKEGYLKKEEVEELIDDIIALLKDPNERIALDAIKFLRYILENVELSDKNYNKVMEALMEVVSSGKGVLGEYAAEGLGILGVKISKLVRKIIKLLVSLIKGSKEREVQSAAMTALTEIASKSKDKEIVEEVMDEIMGFLDSEDKYLRERALSAIGRVVTTQRGRISKGLIDRVREKVSLFKSGGLEEKASEVLSALAAAEKESKQEEYRGYKIEQLLDMEKHEVVAEMAKENEEVLERVLEMLSSQDYIRKTDALWVISRIVDFLGPSRAYSILPTLGDLAKSKNPWVRSTAVKTLSNIYFLYPGTKNYIVSLLDLLLKSSDKKAVEAGLELIKEISTHSPTKDLFTAAIILTLKRLGDKDMRLPILRFYALTAENLLYLDRDILEAMFNKLNEIYKDATDEEKKIIISLLDLINTLLKKEEKA